MKLFFRRRTTFRSVRLIPWVMVALVSCLFAESRDSSPNVLVILVDDLGWRDVGFAGNDFIETPRVDQLAREGTVFTQGYASAPNCAPTRACLLTGEYAPRHGVYTVVDDRHRPGSAHHKVLAAESRSDLPTECVTIAEILRDRGYSTGMIGMWNLGRGRYGPTTPGGQGFSFVRQPKDLGFETDAYHDADGRDLTEVMAAEGEGFIETHRERPWFLYFAPHAVHEPFDPDSRLMEKYRDKLRDRGGRDDPAQAATVESMDLAVGKLMETLERLDLTRRTLVVFTSDNGGTRQYVAPLRGGKGALYEGGLRVPLVIRGPGVRAGARCDTPVLSMDLFSTVMDVTGSRPPSGTIVDGKSLCPLLSGKPGFERDSVFWHFPCYVGGSGPSSAIRRGDMKLIEFFESGRSELYDLKNDPGETRDLSQSRPDVAGDMLERLHRWQESTRAPRPTTPNPGYDPDAVPPRGRDQRGKGGGPRKPSRDSMKSNPGKP